MEEELVEAELAEMLNPLARDKAHPAEEIATGIKDNCSNLKDLALVAAHQAGSVDGSELEFNILDLIHDLYAVRC